MAAAKKASKYTKALASDLADPTMFGGFCTECHHEYEAHSDGVKGPCLGPIDQNTHTLLSECKCDGFKEPKPLNPNGRALQRRR